MHAVIGLGNPGNEYTNTRHNVGFLVVDALAQKLGAAFSNKRSLQAHIASAHCDGERVLLVKPQTFMNVSGSAVAAIMSKNPVKPKDLLIVYDDADLPFGDVRMKTSGSSAGHRGMESILEAIGKHHAIARVRVGIGRSTNPDIALEDFVLGTWSKTEQTALPEVTQRALALIESFIHGRAL